MNKLENVLVAMDQINDRMHNALRTTDAERNRKIVELRQEFATETGNLISLMPDDTRLISQPTLFIEFQDRLEAVRNRLTSHQAKWSIHDITERRIEYLTAADAVHASISDYVSWAKGTLTGP